MFFNFEQLIISKHNWLFFFYWKYNVENMINQIICVYSDNGKKLILKC